MPYYPQMPAAVAAGVVAKEGRLISNGADVKLVRFDGYQLMINGVNCDIPLAGLGVTAAAAAAVAPGGAGGANSMVYYYAYMSGGVMAIEVSATAPAVDATTGVMIKTGDATRTLAGKSFVHGGPQIGDLVNSITQVSYFNRRRKAAQAIESSVNSTLSSPTATWIEIFGTETRAYFVKWFDDVVLGMLCGRAYTNTLSAVGRTAVALWEYGAAGANVMEGHNMHQSVGTANGSHAFCLQPMQSANSILDTKLFFLLHIGWLDTAGAASVWSASSSPAVNGARQAMTASVFG